MKKSLLILGTITVLSLSTVNANANENVLSGEVQAAINEFNNDINYANAINNYQAQAEDFVLADMISNIDALKTEIENQIILAKNNNQTDVVITLETYLRSLDNNNISLENNSLNNMYTNEFEIAMEMQDSINNILSNINNNGNSY